MNIQESLLHSNVLNSISSNGNISKLLCTQRLVFCNKNANIYQLKRPIIINNNKNGFLFKPKQNGFSNSINSLKFNPNLNSLSGFDFSQNFYSINSQKRIVTNNGIENNNWLFCKNGQIGNKGSWLRSNIPMDGLTGRKRWYTTKTEGMDRDKEEEEDELNKILDSKDNFIVREWKEMKSLIWYLIFGTQILVQEVQLADEAKKKRIEKKPLTRREELLIRRSFHDIIFAIPFMVMITFQTYYTLLLIAIFPNLIPTVYITPYQMKKRLERNKKIRIKIAKKAEKLAPWVPFDVSKFYSEKSILLLCKEKHDAQINIDTLSWWHLKSCANYLGIYSILPKSLLKVRLDEYLSYIESDDKLIKEEGINSLSLEELRMANEQRGFSSLGLSKKELQFNLNNWIDFHFNSENIKVPRLLTVLSRIYADKTILNEDQQRKKQQKKQQKKNNKKFNNKKKTSK